MCVKEQRSLLDQIFDHPKSAGFLAFLALALAFSPKASLIGTWTCLIAAWIFASAMIFGIPRLRRRQNGKTIGTVSVLLLAVVLFAFGYWLRGGDGNVAGFMQLGKAFFNKGLVAENQRLQISIWIKNGGQTPVTNEFQFFAVKLVPVGSDPDATDRQVHADSLREALAQHSKWINEGKQGATISKGEGAWDTLLIPDKPQSPLTKEQADSILSGQYRLYVYVWSRWRDAPLDLDRCGWLQPPLTSEYEKEKLIWHLCSE